MACLISPFYLLIKTDSETLSLNCCNQKRDYVTTDMSAAKHADDTTSAYLHEILSSSTDKCTNVYHLTVSIALSRT